MSTSRHTELHVTCYQWSAAEPGRTEVSCRPGWLTKALSLWSVSRLQALRIFRDLDCFNGRMSLQLEVSTASTPLLVIEHNSTYTVWFVQYECSICQVIFVFNSYYHVLILKWILDINISTISQFRIMKTSFLSVQRWIQTKPLYCKNISGKKRVFCYRRDLDFVVELFISPDNGLNNESIYRKLSSNR